MPRKSKPLTPPQERLLAAIKRAGYAFKTTTEPGIRLASGRRVNQRRFKALVRRGLVQASGDALLEGDTQTWKPRGGG